MSAVDSTVERSRARLAPWIAAAIAVVLVAFLAVLATSPAALTTQARSPLLGKPAPEVAGETIDGGRARLSSLRGRYVVLNFFASWCVPCREEHDDLIRFSERHEQSGDAAVLAVLFDDAPDNARRFFEEHGGDWPVVIDERGKVALDYGVRGPPESFLVAPNGYVVAKIVGEVDDAGLERLIAEAERRSRG